MAVDRQHQDVGAYVLGVLDPADVEPFEAHLASCDGCAGEVAAMLPVVAMLCTADAGSLESVTRQRRVPALDHVIPRPAPRHGRSAPLAPSRRGRVAVAAGIVAVLLGGGAFAVGRWSATGPAGATAAGPRASAPGVGPSGAAGQLFEATDPVTGAQGRLTVATAGWGSQLQLELRGVRGPLRCELIAVGVDGGSTVVSSWLVSEAGYGVPGQPNPLRVQAATAISLAATSHFEIKATRPDGRASRLLSIPA